MGKIQSIIWKQSQPYDNTAEPKQSRYT